MTIGIDARMVQHTGIGTYLKGLLRNVNASNREAMTLFGNEQALESYEGYARAKFSSKIYSIREQLEYPQLLKQCKLWHAPHYNVPFIKGSTKLVVTIHDLIHWIFRKEHLSLPQRIYAEIMLKRAVTLADHIITVSESTKNDLEQQFNVPSEKMSVIYEGGGDSFEEVPAEEAQLLIQGLGINKPYFLYVGLMKPHKQVQQLLRCFHKLKESHRIDADLVIVGRGNTEESYIKEEWEAVSQRGDFHHLPNVSQRELNSLYQEAVALTHPSEYEGFGLTLLEALKCKTPVIACEVASIPEVAGRGAYYVQPRVDQELEEAMICLESDGDLRQKLVREGQEQLDQFSWKQMAEKTVGIYQRVLEKL